MFLTIPHMEKGYLLESGEINLRDQAEQGKTIHCVFIAPAVCRWLDANGWKLYINQWHDRPMFAEAAPYPLNGFILYVSDEGKLVMSAETITQSFQNPRGGNYNISSSVVSFTGSDPIELHKQMMVKAEEIVDAYAQEAKEELRYINKPTEESEDENEPLHSYTFSYG